jgi:uncharacterized membrane protein
MNDQSILFTKIVERIGLGIDGLGVAVIVIGVLIATFSFLSRSKKQPFQVTYVDYRQNLGRIILLGLEFLVAGDIVRTVAVSPTYTSVGLLSIIILIRFVLSMQLEIEINGSLPWQSKGKK